MNLGHVYYTCTVQPSTKKTYSSAERRWFSVAESIGTDPCMKTIPLEWQNRTDRFQHSTMTWPEACMTILLVSFTIGRALAPRTVSSYLSAVKKYLENEGVDTKFFKNSQYIRNTKQGLTLAYRVETNKTSLDAARLPITADMIILYYKITAPRQPTLQQRALFVAQLTGFTMVARVSEYLYTSKSEHWLTTDRVQFEMPDGTTIPAHHAHKHASTTPIAVHIHIRTRKNDQKGRGHTLHFHRANQTDKYCYVSEMWAHATCARPIAKGPFFAIPSENWTLKAPQLSLHLKNMATHFGIDSSRVSTHSLRIGGASTLAAAGLTDSEIMRIGAWRSATFLTYIRENNHMFEKARAALAGSEALTIADVRRLDTANGTRPVHGSLQRV